MAVVIAQFSSLADNNAFNPNGVQSVYFNVPFNWRRVVVSLSAGSDQAVDIGRVLRLECDLFSFRNISGCLVGQYSEKVDLVLPQPQKPISGNYNVAIREFSNNAYAPANNANIGVNVTFTFYPLE